MYGLKAIAPEVLQTLEDIISSWETCKRISSVSQRYRSTLGAENTRFGAKVYIGFMYREAAPAFSMYDDATHFN